MLNPSYEYKLLLTQEQVQEVERTLEICCRVWNYALRERKNLLNASSCSVNACSILGEYIIDPSIPDPNYPRQCKALTAAKEQYPELTAVNAQMLQQVLRKPDTAFADRERQGKGFPRFKNRYRMRSFVFPQMLKNCWQGNDVF